MGARTAFIEPGSPWENGYIESFNARLRDELLNGEIFYTPSRKPRFSSNPGDTITTPCAPHSSPGIPAAGTRDDRHAKLAARLRYAPPATQLGRETGNALTFDLDQSTGAGHEVHRIAAGDDGFTDTVADALQLVAVEPVVLVKGGKIFHQADCFSRSARRAIVNWRVVAASVRHRRRARAATLPAGKRLSKLHNARFSTAAISADVHRLPPSGVFGRRRWIGARRSVPRTLRWRCRAQRPCGVCGLLTASNGACRRWRSLGAVVLDRSE